MRRTSKYTWLVVGIAWPMTLAACGGGPSPDAERLPAPAAPGSLSGRVTVDGSSTVLPVSKALADDFHKAHPSVEVSVSSSGTSGGFEMFCAGKIDLTGASRPMNASESRQCQANNVEFIELPVAFDSLSVVVNTRNTFARCLTVAELKKMWEPAAEGKVKQWNQIRSSFPAEPLALFGPGTSSGTFDYFTLAIVGAERSSRADYTRSEDDTALANGIAADPNALGYFGYAYYLANKSTLRPVAIDNGRGCVEPSPESVEDMTYQPLARPIFVYLSTSAAKRQEVSELARSYVNPNNSELVRDIGYVPLPPATLLTVARRLDQHITGSIFEGRGSVVGVTADAFREEDRVKNALVR